MKSLLSLRLVYNSHSGPGNPETSISEYMGTERNVLICICNLTSGIKLSEFMTPLYVILYERIKKSYPGYVGQ